MNAENSSALNSKKLQSSASNYWPALDGLRALAVVGVVFQHTADLNTPWSHLNLGWIGVHSFFVLSGFLITEILLACRKGIEDGRGESGMTIRQFYIRRFLRIFPVYYLALFIAAAGNLQDVRATFWWHFFYSTNLYDAVHHVGVWAVGHFWSLSVEEQFYIVWPWLILLLPERWIVRTILGSIALGFGCRLVSVIDGVNDFVIYTSTLTCIDSLGIGALLAYVGFKPSLRWMRPALARIGLFIGLPILIGLTIDCMLGEAHETQLVLYNTSIALTAVWLIVHATSPARQNSWFNRLFASTPLVYVGRISYGMYVYHIIVMRVAPKAIEHLSLHYPSGLALRLVINLGLLLIVASFSWLVMEKPINDLKRHFKYFPARKSRSAAPASAAVQTDGMTLAH